MVYPQKEKAVVYYCGGCVQYRILRFLQQATVQPNPTVSLGGKKTLKFQKGWTETSHQATF